MVAMMELIRFEGGARKLDEKSLAVCTETPPAAAEVEIDVSCLSIVFDGPNGQVFAVDRASLQVSRGEFICILGPSGCGKSTLLNAIAGFVRPFEGEVRVFGAEVTGPGPDRGMVFQQPLLFPWKTVRANIAYGPRMAGRAPSEVAAITDRLIELVGLVRFADSYPHMLSGGMQQRVAIARALAIEPRVLLMDEPFGALDAQTRLVMQENLLSLWAQVKATVIFVTHDIDEAIFLADRVIIMGAGGHILRDLSIKLPRPRDSAVALSPSFMQVKAECFGLIREESRKAFELHGKKS
jgi:NitT/TauT family transport system ATP-binding protein